MMGIMMSERHLGEAVDVTDRLGLAVQTVSAQVRLLEQSLGYALFKPAGRGLALTDAGQAALKVGYE